MAPKPVFPTPPAAAKPVNGERAVGTVKRILGTDPVVEHAPEAATIMVPAERLVEVVVALRDDPQALFEMPVTMTCVDWPERDPRFEVSYLLRSLAHNDLVRLLLLASEETEVPSLAQVLPGMEWHERECYDLFGLNIVNHPNLTRILLPDDWEGHPLRKDYVSFGEPVAFTHNLEWALSSHDRPEYMPGAIRGSVERS